MALKRRVDVALSDKAPEELLGIIASNMDRFLIDSYPEREGFELIANHQFATSGKTPVKESFFNPVGYIGNLAQVEADKQKCEYKVHRGALDGVEIKIVLNSNSIAEIDIEVDWTSKLCSALETGGFFLSVLFGLFLIGGGLMERYQQEGFYGVAMFIVLPWRLLWYSIIFIFIAIIPMMFLARMIAQGISVFSARDFGKIEREMVMEKVVSITQASN